MHPGLTATQIKAVKSVKVYNCDGQSILGQHNSRTTARSSRGKLWCRPAKQLRFAIRSAATLTKTDQTAETYRVPEALQKYVAQCILHGCKQPVQVYILGASHVSRQSCTHATELIATIKPEVLLLELCKDRVDLLVEPSMPPPQHWHSRVINFHSNFPQQSSFTAAACKKLLSQLRCQPGRSFAACDIEQDCIQLLASGMFASVVPVTQPASDADAPMFVHNSSQVLSHSLKCISCKVSGTHQLCVSRLKQSGRCPVLVPVLQHSIALCALAHNWNIGLCQCTNQRQLYLLAHASWVYLGLMPCAGWHSSPSI